jgi:hypothetical protein
LSGDTDSPYSLSIAHKNSLRNENNKKVSTQTHLKNRKQNSGDLATSPNEKSNVVESSYLMHGRGARSNSTSIEDLEYNLGKFWISFLYFFDFI